MAHQITAEGGSNLSPTAPVQLWAEGGANLSPTAPVQLGAEGGTNLTPSSPGAVSAEGGADRTPLAPLQLAGETAAIARTAATLTTALAGTNNDIVWTAAVTGPEGNDITVGYTAGEGACQVETVTIAGTITQNGYAQVVMTSSLFGGEQLGVWVAVLETNGPAAIAAKIVTALNADPTYAEHFVASTGGPQNYDVVTTAKVAADSDPLLLLTVNNGTCAGIAGPIVSVSTVAGSAGPATPAVSVSGTAITIGIYAGVTTAAQVIAAAAESAAASALATGANAPGNNGTGTLPLMSPAALTGGTGLALPGQITAEGGA